ncbi:hypothetical protein ACJJTC_007957 [Scirpophaga incertulas]
MTLREFPSETAIERDQIKTAQEPTADEATNDAPGYSFDSAEAFCDQNTDKHLITDNISSVTESGSYFVRRSRRLRQPPKKYDDYILYGYILPWILYGAQAGAPGYIASVAAICWSGHYAKRLLETLFVHRFSHGTMPLRNLFRNCGYYWLFTLYVAYHVNHPLYTPPNNSWFFIGLGGFIFCELGNLSIHILLKNLRPPGTKVRRVPKPDGNPFSLLFNFVSCPNYTYEVGSWVFFTIMTKCAPVGLFAAAGFYQMAMWAIGKHRNYKKEFPDYPKGRKAILPFIL